MAASGGGGVDAARGVVGRVHHDRARPRPDRPLERRQVGLEVGEQRRHRDEHAAEVTDVGAVLDEVRRGTDHLVPGLQHRAEERDEPAGGAARQEDVARLDRDLLLGGDPARDRRAGGREAGVRAVAEPHRLHHLLGELAQDRGRGGRRRHVGVAEAEVEHVIGADALLQLDPRLEHAADPGGVLHLLANLGGHHVHRGSIGCRDRIHTAGPRPDGMAPRPVSGRAARAARVDPGSSRTRGVRASRADSGGRPQEDDGWSSET